VLVSFHDSALRRSDLALLEGEHWLNDAVIAFWFEYMQYTLFPDCKRVLLIGPEVTQLVKMSEPGEISVFLEPLEAPYKDYILLPVNDHESSSAGGTHWSLLVFSRLDRKWFHYDSLPGTNEGAARCLVSRLNRYLERTATLVKAACTRQSNGFDCGLFTLLNAQYAVARAGAGLAMGENCVPAWHALELRGTIGDVARGMARGL